MSRSGSALVLLACWLAPAQAWGQGDGAAETSPAAPQIVIQQAPSTTTTQTTSSAPFGYPQAGTDLESYLGSSSQAVTDIHQSDTFDLRKGSDGSLPVLRGRPGAPGILNEQASGNSGVYVVRPGDTLSKISQRLYGQPWEWPRLWSLNPQVQNPHWIYPGDQLRLTAVGGGMTRTRQTRTLGSGEVGPLRADMDPNTIFLRRYAYIDDPDKGVMGEIVGALDPVQLMSEGQGIYVVLRPEQTVEAGQLLSIFRPSRNPPTPRGARRPPGQIVKVEGTVRVQYFNPETRVVRGEIVESLDVIERGAKVGKLDREFRFVAPRRATKNVATRILAGLYPHHIVGSQQVVFIDHGAKDGLRDGNRLFVIRRGDSWRRTLGTASDTARTRLRMDVQESLQLEETPLHGDEQAFPEEVVGELRIISTQPFSALALIVEAKSEIVPGDRAVARTGF